MRPDQGTRPGARGTMAAPSPTSAGQGSPPPGPHLDRGPCGTGGWLGCWCPRDPEACLPVKRVRSAPGRVPMPSGRACPLSGPLPAASLPWHVPRPRGPEVQTDTRTPLSSSGNDPVDLCEGTMRRRPRHSCTFSLLIKSEHLCAHSSVHTHLCKHMPTSPQATLHMCQLLTIVTIMVNRRLNPHLLDAKPPF